MVYIIIANIISNIIKFNNKSKYYILLLKLYKNIKNKSCSYKISTYKYVHLNEYYFKSKFLYDNILFYTINNSKNCYEGGGIIYTKMEFNNNIYTFYYDNENDTLIKNKMQIENRFIIYLKKDYLILFKKKILDKQLKITYLKESGMVRKKQKYFLCKKKYIYLYYLYEYNEKLQMNKLVQKCIDLNYKSYNPTINYFFFYSNYKIYIRSGIFKYRIYMDCKSTPNFSSYKYKAKENRNIFQLSFIMKLFVFDYFYFY